MLVLSRKPGERILIGNDVVVTVVRIGPNTVRLGIDAPSNLRIIRQELFVEEDQSSPSPNPPQSSTTENPDSVRLEIVVQEPESPIPPTTNQPEPTETQRLQWLPEDDDPIGNSDAGY